MIQREWKPCTIYSLTSDTDAFGQRRLQYDSIEQREIFIKPYRERESNNPIYLETQYVALIKGDISTNQLIQVGETYYRIIDLIYAPKYNQLFLKETKERPEPEHLSKPTNFRAVVGALGITLSCDPVKNAEWYYWEFDTVDNEYFFGGTQGSPSVLVYYHYAYWLYVRPDWPGITCKVRMRARSSVYGVSDWTDWITLTIGEEISSPDNFTFTATDTEYQFNCSEVPEAVKYRIIIRGGQAVVQRNTVFDTLPYTISKADCDIPSGVYRYMITALPADNSGYIESEFNPVNVNQWPVCSIE